jgi:hypothetical protein
MRNAQTLATLPFGQPAPQVDAGGYHVLVEVGRRYRSGTIPMPALGVTSRAGDGRRSTAASVPNTVRRQVKRS